MILLVGHGYVGKYIAAEMTKTNTAFRWVNHEYIINAGVPEECTVVINAAGFTGVPNVDACEKNKDDTMNGNVLFPVFLEYVSRVPVIHISSGCVYSGYPEGGFTEEDPTNLFFDNGSFYSASKSLVQELLVPYLEKRSYLFRIRMPFGPDNLDKNLLMKYYKYDKLVDFENSVSYLPDVAAAAVHFALHIDFIPPGIYNAVNPQPTSTKKITEIMGLNKEWFTQEEFKAAVVAPRSNCTLNPDKMQAVFKFKDTEDALKDAVEYIRKIPL